MKAHSIFKKCTVCKREFECYDKPKKRGHRQTKYKRPFKALTCSKPCSIKHAYAGRKLTIKLKREVKK